MKRGLFLKMLGIGAGAATVAKGNIKDNSKTEFKNQWLGEPFPDNLPVGGFQDDNLYPNLHEYDHYGIGNDISPYNGHWRQCVCIKSSPMGMNRIGDLIHLRNGAIMPMYWIELKGQGLLRSKFRELDEAVYCGDINNSRSFSFYHADDPAGKMVNTNGKYLILPDARDIPY